MILMRPGNKPDAKPVATTEEAFVLVWQGKGWIRVSPKGTQGKRTQP